MVGRIVDVMEDGRHLSVNRGLLEVRDGGFRGPIVGTVPLDDVGAVIVHARDVAYRNSTVVRLAERGVPLVFCDQWHVPVAISWPCASHHELARRIDGQVSTSLPTAKRLWASVVRAKVLQQAVVIEALGGDATGIRALAREVRSGDPANIEAQAARRYWPTLFGAEFRRDRKAGGINGLLNYGYTVLRAGTARAVAGAGLHPAIGIHHSNDGNPFRLVDDLMEPFRPFTDLTVVRLASGQPAELTREFKAALLSVLYLDLGRPEGRTPVTVAMQRLATSLAQVYLGQRDTLELPQPTLPLDDAQPKPDGAV